MENWNREEEWEIHRYFVERSSISVIIDPKHRLTQMASIRRIVPDLAELPIADFFNRIDTKGRLEIAEMAGRIAQPLVEQLLAADLEVESIDTSTVSFLPFNRTQSFVLKIRNPVKSKQVVDEMTSARVPIIDIGD